jgi:hypothetical protein
MMLGYGFVLTDMVCEADMPYELVPGHCLRRAEPDEVATIKSVLNGARFRLNRDLPLPYEVKVIPAAPDKAGNQSSTWEPLSPADCRYWVITCEQTTATLHKLGYALALMKQGIEIGLEIYTGATPNGVGFHTRDLPPFPDRMTELPKTITGEDLQLAVRCYDKAEAITDEHDHILRALRQFSDLRSLPRFSDLIVIGLFSIIESLLTHNPSGSADSLTRQISHKIPLLRKRFIRDVNYESWFEQGNEKQLWKKLYAYRSMIAHGAKVELSGKLSCLKNNGTVVSFLREIVKLLLIQALEEPVLMTDLKEC